MANSHSLDLESGSSQYASITDAAQTGLDITGDIAIEAWIKLESSKVHTIASKWVTNQESYLLRVDGSNIYWSVTSDGSTNDNYSKATTLNNGTWYHVAVSFDASASTATFYVDGSLLGTDSGTATSIHNSTTAFEIGRYNAGNDFFDGLIDDVRIWNTVRSGAQIAANYTMELVGNESGLQGYWKFNNDATDETANGNNLTGSGGPVFSVDIPDWSPEVAGTSLNLQRYNYYQ